MAYPIDEKLVVAIASSALFNLAQSHEVYESTDLETYRRYQRDHEDDPLDQGPAFSFIRRLLTLNLNADDSPVEVVLLSRNDPDTGLRVMNSIAHHSLGMSRAAFLNGEYPWRYVDAFNATLFLSANEFDVRAANDAGLPAGQVFGAIYMDDRTDQELRIAFDFDGVVADDSAEAVFQAGGLDLFHQHEAAKADIPLPPGPLQPFLAKVGELQQHEHRRKKKDPFYRERIVTALITARDAPAHERVVKTLRSWGIDVDKAFFLGGIDKTRILAEFRPHIFFDDQVMHVENAAGVVPSVFIPYGDLNESHAPHGHSENGGSDD